MYGLLLFGGSIQVNHVSGALKLGNSWINVKAWPRIGVLVNQLRRLLDLYLQHAVENNETPTRSDNPILDAILALLTRDGVGTDSL